MELESELRNQIESFVQGRVSLAALRDWLEDHAEDVARLDNGEAKELADLAWVLFAEMDYGHASEGEVLARLREGPVSAGAAIFTNASSRRTGAQPDSTVIRPSRELVWDVCRPAPLAGTALAAVPS